MTASILARHHVRVSGRGVQPLVLAHGFGCNQAMWRHVAPAFEDTHRVIVFDHLGAGNSDISAYDAEAHATLHGYADDVLAILAALDVWDVIFVGHSVSAMIGMLAATKAPARFSRLVHVGPSPCYANDPPEYMGGFERADLDGLLEMMVKNYTGWAGALAPLAVGPHNPASYTSEIEASFCATDPTIARQFAAVTFLSDHRADVPRVPVPSLILQCAQDAIAPNGVGEWLARHLPHSTYHPLAATGHFPHLTHPDETITAIREWLSEPVDMEQPRTVPRALALTAA